MTSKTRTSRQVSRERRQAKLPRRGVDGRWRCRFGGARFEASAVDLTVLARPEGPLQVARENVFAKAMRKSDSGKVQIG